MWLPFLGRILQYTTLCFYTLILLCITIAICLVSMVAAAPQPSDEVNSKDIQILSYQNDAQPEGSYNYAYVQSDGTKAEQVGTIKKDGEKDAVLSISGSYSWISPDGITFTVKYVADEAGYRAEIINSQDASGLGNRFGSDVFQALLSG